MKTKPRQAFTLVEMLVVIGILGILAALLLPALSKGKQQAQGVSCLNNGKQMMAAITMYASDNHEFFPPNPDDGNVIAGHDWVGGQAGRGGADEFNPDLLSDPKRSLLLWYLGGNISLFRCPSDLRMGLYQGTNLTYIGRMVPSARTFSMSQAVGTICPAYDKKRGRHSGAPSLSVNGPWLSNNFHHHRDTPWITYGTMSGIRAPGPSGLWVLIDEDYSGLNDAAFAYGMAAPIWYDAPGTYHNFGCGFAFADGHSETHQWKYHAEKKGRGFHIKDPADRLDWLWMRDRTSANITGVMPPPQP